MKINEITIVWLKFLKQSNKFIFKSVEKITIYNLKFYKNAFNPVVHEFENIFWWMFY